MLVPSLPQFVIPTGAGALATAQWRNLLFLFRYRRCHYRFSSDGITIAFSTRFTRLSTIAPTNAAKNPRT